MDPARKRATYEDLLALPEGVHAEIIDGEIRVFPSPLPEHSFAQNVLGSSVGVPFQASDGGRGPGGWWILPEVDVRFESRDTIRPDLAGWRRERLPNPRGIRPIEIPPDWICEIVSPSSMRHDNVVKRALYARSGVQFFWIVDPEARTLAALRLAGQQWLELGVWDDTATVRIPPFDAIEIEVGALFLPPPASGPDGAAS